MVDIHTPPALARVTGAGHMDALAIGTRLAEFEIKGLLGVGGFGMVYRGYDHSLHRAVAIKEYMPTSLVGRDNQCSVTVKSVSDAAAFESGLRSFIAEARLLARFDHPSLVKVYRFWEANNTAYMAMPLYEGITLKEARRRMSGPPPQEWLQSVLWSVLAGLKVLHDNSTLHRDVSPDNIFLQNIGPPVLLDLGAARRAILDTSQKHTAILKVNYAPIEQYADARDMQEGPWTDLYAVAAVIHGCVCNEPPLPATFRAVRDRLPVFSQVALTAETHFNQKYAEGFVSAISHALAIEPAERTVSVEAFIQEIGMKSPPDLARFDWRAALGDSVTVVETGNDPAPITTELLTTRPVLDFPDTVLQPSTFDHSKTIKVPPKAESPVRQRRDVAVQGTAARKSLWLWAIVGMALVASLMWFLRPVALSTMAAPPIEHVLTPSPVEAEAAPVAPPPQVQAKQDPAAVPLAPAKSASGAVASARAKPIAAPKSPVGTGASPAVSERPANPSAAGAAAGHGGADKPLSGASPANDPIAICATASIFTRTMCVYRECQRPEFYNLAVCVADRKHWEEQNKSRN